jgi:hypothetical protein
MPLRVNPRTLPAVVSTIAFSFEATISVLQCPAVDSSAPDGAAAAQDGRSASVVERAAIAAALLRKLLRATQDSAAFRFCLPVLEFTLLFIFRSPGARL